MNQYRVSLWIENQGDIPDKYFQLQTNALPDFDEVAMSMLFLAHVEWAREVHVEWFFNGVWNLEYRRLNLTLRGSEEMYLR